MAAYQRPSPSSLAVSADPVAEWLATEERLAGPTRLRAAIPSAAVDPERVEEMFDRLDPVRPSRGAAALKELSDFYAFFGKEHVQAPAAAKPSIAERDASGASGEIEWTPLEASAGRALSSVEELYEAFKRLEQQLETISESLQTYSQHP